MSKIQVEIDKNACQGFGDDVVAETLQLDELECLREAAEACPFAAIHIVNLETGEKLI